MRVHLILDVTPDAGEVRRSGEEIRTTVEDEIEGMRLDVHNYSGRYVSVHEVHVVGVGASAEEAEQSRRARAQ
jgi:hypothetical protein